MDRQPTLRSAVARELRYTWVYLLIPSLFALVLAGDEVVGGRILLTWITCFLMIQWMWWGTTFTDLLLEARLAPRRLSWRGIAYSAVVIEGWVFAGSALGALMMRPFAPAPMLDWVRTVVWAASAVGAPLTVVSIRSYESYQELRARETRARQAALAAQVQALQARIQPHFLFNCLNTVASLIEEDPARAEAAVLKLSDLFRYSLEASDKRFVPLAEELEVVEGFLEIETLRHPERLKVSLRVEDAVLGTPVPPLLLQPIVENAVLHGIAPRREGGRLEIEVRREDGRLLLAVEDDGPGPGGSLHGGAGTALRDLGERLALLYGDAASLETGAGGPGGFRVEVRIPCATPASGEVSA